MVPIWPVRVHRKRASRRPTTPPAAGWKMYDSWVSGMNWKPLRSMQSIRSDGADLASAGTQEAGVTPADHATGGRVENVRFLGIRDELEALALHAVDPI